MDTFVYPGWEGGYGPGDYTPILEWIGDVQVQQDDDDYQGDTFALVLKDGQWGYVQFGWGSCSGCDALQACSTKAEVATLAAEIRDSTRWGAPAELLEWFKTHDWGGDFRSQTRDAFVNKAVAALEQAAA